MPSAVQTLQIANPSQSTVSRMPQTTAQPTTPAGAAPFTRLSRQGQILGPAESGIEYGDLWTPTLKPVGGYLRYLNFTVAAQGASSSAPSVLTPDAPYNAVQNYFLRDPFGQPIIQCDGFRLNLVCFYGGQRGMLGYGNDVGARPSFTPPALATGAQPFSFNMPVPLEMDSSGYCSLASMNAASQPQVQVQFNPITQVYATPPTTPGTLFACLNEPFWMAPVDNPSIAPPDIGSSAQWSVTRAQSTVTSNAFQRVVLPRVGTFIHTLIMDLRDSGVGNNQRVESWPTSDLSLWIDGVPITFEQLVERRDIMYQQFGSYSYNPVLPSVGKAPAGVVVYSFRESVQTAVSTADTYDLLLPTTPATLLEIAGTFGNFVGNGQIWTTTGELFPVSGIPYTHLAS
jgi:hypothetical protein